ncbi:hypothetical protein BDB13_1565 [Rhodococcus sp. OK302]|nr:hypothetical protein BDB13_1565 [Rhodococcus sp. OK302]
MMSLGTFYPASKVRVSVESQNKHSGLLPTIVDGALACGVDDSCDCHAPSRQSR